MIDLFMSLQTLPDSCATAHTADQMATLKKKKDISFIRFTFFTKTTVSQNLKSYEKTF